MENEKRCIPTFNMIFLYYEKKEVRGPLQKSPEGTQIEIKLRRKAVGKYDEVEEKVKPSKYE